MDRKAPAQRPTPAAPGCAECVRLDDQRRTAELDGDLSRAVDCRVLLRRHRAAAHPGGEQ